jgi:purine catabolism regulator
LANRDAARSWLAIAGDASPAEPPTMHLALGTSLDRTIAPVIGREGLLGCLSLIGPGGSWSGDDALLASRGAAACAIVLAREFASIAARREIELNVLDEVLDGALRNETTLLQQARRLGHDLERPHRLLVVDLVNAADSGAVRPLVSAALERFDDELLWRIRDRFLEIVLPDLIEPDQVVATLQANLGDERVRAGLGSRHAGLAGLQRSRDEARQALMIQSRLGISAAVAHFGDLGVFRLLFAAESLPEFNDLHDETLGALVAYDQEHNADLVQTLRAWFDGKGSPKVASERLGVHRNTVLYRLERIAAMTGYDLADAETRLRLQLALSINTIKGSPASGDGLRGNRSAGAARAESVPA